MRGDLQRMSDLADRFTDYQKRIMEPEPKSKTISPPSPEKARAICHVCKPSQYFWTMEGLRKHAYTEHFLKRS